MADENLRIVRNALRAYRRRHPEAATSAYRSSPASIRVRIVDRRFDGLTRAQRDDEVWSGFFADLGEDVLGEVTMLLLLTPGQLPDSPANREFEARDRIDFKSRNGRSAAK